MRPLHIGWLLLASAFLSSPVALAQTELPADRTPRPSEPPRPADSPRGKVLRQQTEEMNLAVGENQTLSAAGVTSYSEGSPGVAEVRVTPDSSQFVVVGHAPGSTTLLLLKRDGSQITYMINVFPRPIGIVQNEVALLLEGTPGVRIRRVGARFFIEGGVSTEPELKRIEHIAALFPGQVESLVVLGGAAADRKTNVRVDFFFVQFDRGKSYQVGLSYPAGIAGPALTASYDLLAGAFTRATSIVSQPLPGLDLAASKGWAKVLKHSTVITSNGSEAVFSSGGEQNYIVSSGLSASLTQVPFGTDVTVLPRFDPVTRELEVRVNAQVADLTPSVAPGTEMPGRTLSKLNTLVSLRLGQSIVLSGIRTRSERHSVGGLPLLSEIPVLGVLFGSHGNVDQEVDGAILVVPSVVESVPKSAREVLDDALAQYGAFSGDMSDIHTWDEAPSPAASPSAPR
jgi:pilus assembly protein CpaC